MQSMTTSAGRNVRLNLSVPAVLGSGTISFAHRKKIQLGYYASSTIVGQGIHRVCKNPLQRPLNEQKGAGPPIESASLRAFSLCGAYTLRHRYLMVWAW